MTRTFAIATAFICAVSASAHAQATPELSRRADSLLRVFSTGDAPGLAVAVVRDGKVLYSKGQGYANLEHRIPITSSTVFDVASVSKQFAGLAVAMLVQQGKVALSDDIRKYIPELQVMPKPITVNHLLHHTSGMRDWPGTLGLAGWKYDDVISFDQILSMAYHQKTLNFEPGSEYMYSNTGYNLLAEMVKRVTGKPFRVWTDENLFQPLGMTSSVFRDDHTLVVPQRALGYSRGSDGKWHGATNNLTALGSSSLMSSADDMARWLINFDDAKVGGTAAMTLSRTKGILNNTNEIPYAFGISHGTYRSVRTLNHSGSWAAFVSFLVHFPDQKAGVVVLANAPSVNTARAAYALADIFMNDALGAMPSPPAATAPSTSPTATVSTAQLDRYAGAYKLGPAWYVRIRRDGDKLVAHVAGESEAPMTARSTQDFWVANYGASMIFANAPTAPAAFLVYRGKQSPRVDDRGITAPANLTEFAGTYESDELGIAYPVSVRGKSLVLESRQHGDITLTHRWKSDFSGSAGPFRSVEFQRDGTGRINGFLVNIDERSRDIRFVKRK